MLNLELERLGIVDLSNDVEALTQTVGGGRAASATLFFAAGTAESFPITQNYRIIEGVDSSRRPYVSIRTLERNLETGNLYRNPGANSYKGEFANWITRADFLNFDNRDRITVKTS